ncbi:MAG: hypothetical protein JO280_07680 [Mycobacteriaceae bacterium]|nr:hypothetical protein [Mycobacteriaceae bacterium]
MTIPALAGPAVIDRTDAGRAAAKRGAIIRTVIEVAAPLIAFYGASTPNGCAYSRSMRSRTRLFAESDVLVNWLTAL